MCLLSQFDKQVMSAPGLRSIIDFQTNFVVCYRHSKEDGSCLPIKPSDKGKPFYCQEDGFCNGKEGSCPCFAARHMLCARNMTGNFDFTWWDFQVCMMKDTGKEEDPPSHAQTCAKQLSLDYTTLKKCVDGPLGQHLLGEALHAREALRPKFTYSPDLRINGGASFRGKDFLKAICSAYQGPPPKGCSREWMQAVEGNTTAGA